jgi:5'-nucleotidase
MSQPCILVTNDDGVRAPGLKVLAEALSDLGEVHIVAPESEQSAVGHGISLHKPLRVNRLSERWSSVDGTPADCVMLAVRRILDRRPALVVAGINPGANLGDDVTYSGTVAGAFEGMLMNIPAMAVSDISYRPEHMQTAGQVAQQIAARILEDGLPRDTMLSVNVPDVPYDQLKGIRVVRMGRRHYEDEIIERQDPRGRPYYWIGGAVPSSHPEEGTDFEAIENLCVSVTPLHRDLTNHTALELFSGAALTL